jgi:sugar O-acyltransferase (sialic acid O-acetyltransferase NeuD family)
MSEILVLVGAGGHAKVVCEALIADHWPKQNIAVCTEDPGQVGSSFMDFTVARLSDIEQEIHLFHVCIGDNHRREQLTDGLTRKGGRPLTIAHPAALVSATASVKEGAFVAAGAILAAESIIGRGAIVNHGAIVDHDVMLGDFVHIAPGATLAGRVQVGARTLVGAGANLLPGVFVGADATVGAGAVLRDSVPGGSVFAGVPARRIR